MVSTRSTIIILLLLTINYTSSHAQNCPTQKIFKKCNLKAIANLKHDACAEIKRCIHTQDPKSYLLESNGISKALNCTVQDKTVYNKKIKFVMVDFSSGFRSLFAFGASGKDWCLIDQALPTIRSPHGCTVEIDTKKSVNVTLKRTCYQSLDQSEMEAGESDVYSKDCVVKKYDSDGKVYRATVASYSKKICHDFEK